MISTNIADTSLAIDDVVFVIDCGFAKKKVRNSLINVYTKIFEGLVTCVYFEWFIFC